MNTMRSFGLRAPVLTTLSAVWLAGAVAGCSPSKPTAASADQPLTATFAQVEMRTMDSGLSASGLLVPREEAAVTTQLDGYRIAEVLVDQGLEEALTTCLLTPAGRQAFAEYINVLEQIVRQNKPA